MQKMIVKILLQQIAAAAPIRDHDGTVIAAISCVGFYESSIDLDDLGVIVKDVGNRISSNLVMLSVRR